MSKNKICTEKQGSRLANGDALKNALKVKVENIEESEAFDSMLKNLSSEENEIEKDDVEHSVCRDSSSDDGLSDKGEESDIKVTKLKSEYSKKRKKYIPLKDVSQNKKPKINFVTEKVNPPTLEEINDIKETRNIFHSNIFRLQVKEMLEEVKVKAKYTKYINNFLEQFKNFLKTVENMAEKENVEELKWLKISKITVPLNLHFLKLENKAFKFQFIKPATEPFRLGACSTLTLLGPKIQADIGVLMPKECWQKEDYLNLKYDHKRAIYLTYLTEKLLESEAIPYLNSDHLKFDYYNNNPLKPVLVITPPEEAGKQLSQKLSLRIFIASEQQSFKLNRFVPWNNNVRSKIVESNRCEDTVPFATPSYNANVLFDLTMNENQKLLHEVFETNKNFQEGLILIKVWLRQRQLDRGYSGFNAHILSMFIVYLVKQRKLHSNMSSYQVARNVWNQLAFSAWNDDNKGISIYNNDNNSLSNRPTLEQFHTYYPVVFIDATGFYNISANVSVDVYKKIRLEAKLAVDMLNDMKVNSFQYLFLTRLPLYTQIDNILKINKADAVEQVIEMHVSPADKQNYVGFTYPLLLKVFSSLLQKGLGKRIEFMLPLEQLTTAWNINETAAVVPQHLHLGLVLNSEYAYEILDKGPESIDDEAAKFRAFWGEKAQLRRFQDGTITESVVWAAQNDDLCKKRLIVRSIVLYLLQHHFQLEEKDVEYIAGEFDTMFALTKCFKVEHLKLPKTKISQDTNAEALTLPVIREFDDLARKVNSLKELPLEIVSVSGISPVLRYCEPQPILPRARCIKEQIYADQIQYGVIQLGQSGKWPGELGALRALKTAFYIQIAQLLREKYKFVCKITYDGVLVLKQGYCFNLEIAHPKEVGLLKKEKTEKGITTHIDCTESITLEKRHYILPKVTGALKALYQDHTSFGPTVMIAKRWLYCQLVDNGVWPDECTELLIASQYLKTADKCITNSPQIGFIRFLHLLAHTDWKSELFLLNFNNALEETVISELEYRFATERESFPPLCIVTSFDQKHYGKIWTSDQEPNIHVLIRVTLLARQCLEIIEASLLSTSMMFIKPAKIFKAPTQGYEFLIQFNPDNIPNTLALDFSSSFVDFTKPNWRMPLAGSNFLQKAVSKLREAYSEFAAFFYNPCGGKEIAVLWNPAAFNVKDFKVAELNGCSLTADHKRIQAKREVLIQDFKIILKDFYLNMGSPEFVKEISQNRVQQTAAKLPANKSRYFTAPGTSKEIKRHSIEKRKNESESSKKTKKILIKKRKLVIESGKGTIKPLIEKGKAVTEAAKESKKTFIEK